MFMMKNAFIDIHLQIIAKSAVNIDVYFGNSFLYNKQATELESKHMILVD